MSKTATVFARVEPELKDKAENILDSLGLSSSVAINMFYKQIVLHNGIPFGVTIPNHPLDIRRMTREEFENILNEGHDQIKHGNFESADKVFADLEKEFGI